MNLQVDVGEWRRFRGLSQEALAAHVGVSRTTIFNIEQGRHEPKVGLALRLSEELGVDVELLFHWDWTDPCSD